VPDAFPHDVLLSYSAKDKAVVQPPAERLRADGLKVWPVAPKRPRVGGFDERVLEPGDSIPAKIHEGLDHSCVLVLCRTDKTHARLSAAPRAPIFNLDCAGYHASFSHALNSCRYADR
jgi:hypothetical protein